MTNSSSSFSDSYDSIDVSSLTKDEVVERLKQHNLFYTSRAHRSLVQLRDNLSSFLRAKHPIHTFVETLNFDELKAIWIKFYFKGKFQLREKTKLKL